MCEREREREREVSYLMNGLLVERNKRRWMLADQEVCETMRENPRMGRETMRENPRMGREVDREKSQTV